MCTLIHPGDSGDVTASLEVRSSPSEESVTLHATLRMLTCLMDTVGRGEIEPRPSPSLTLSRSLRLRLSPSLTLSLRLTLARCQTARST